MFKKELPIIFIGLCVVIAVLVLGWSVFVRQELSAPIKPSVIMDDNNQNSGSGEVIDDSSDVEDNVVDDNDVSNWKIYQNEEFGFEIEYPSVLYFFDCSKFYNSYPLYIYFTPYIEDSCNMPKKAMRSVISISTVENFDKNKIINLLDKDKKERNIIIGNKSAIQISGNREVVGDEGEKLSSVPIRKMVYTIIPLENNISIEVSYHQIVSVKNDANGFYVGKNLNEIYEKMLSTFKFIELTDDTSDWKTYQNEKYGFEMKYPEFYLVEDKTEKFAGDDPSMFPWYSRTDFLLNFIEFKDLNLRGGRAFTLQILNTTDENKIKSSGGWEFIKESGVRKIEDLDIYLYSIDSGTNNMQVIFHNDKAYKFFHYLLEEDFDRIISTFKFIK